LSAPNFARGQAPPPPPAGEVVTGEVQGIETLTHGPLHEAFAAPTNTDPVPGAIVPKQPPANIDEEPPELKAEGAIWIGGYWEWDDEMKDFIWVSGNWRVPPPGMRWVPSYWVEAEGGWQRVPGFWISADAGELEYREMPPESLEVGPSGPAPADNYFWIPGTWNYYETGYRWRTGYWSPYQADWIWCPARWVWTPGGCIYTAGFWDRRVPVRGWCFAPIRFRTPLYLNVGFRYRPWCAVPTDNLFVHLWFRPRSSCYYFGNYYGRGGDFIPWYRCGWGDNRRYYDPLGSWCRTHYRRQGIDYTARMDSWHDHFVRNENLRPPRTWRDQRDLIGRTGIDVRESQRVLGADLRDLARRNDLPVKLTRLDPRERDALSLVNDQLKSLRTQRLKVEATGQARVAARVPLDSDRADRPDRPKPDATARAREEVKLRLPKLDSQTAARIDAALGAGVGTTAGAPAPSRTLPAALDPGRAADRTSRLDRPDRVPETDRADDVLRELRERNRQPDLVPGESPRTPRVEVPERTPGIDPADRTPKVEIPDRTPRGEAPDRRPGLEAPDRTPRTDPRETGPGRVEAPGIDQSDRVPRLDIPRRTTDQSDRVPRPDVGVTPRVERPTVDRTPAGRPDVDIPRVTPRVVSPRSLPDSDAARPRVDIPRVTPRPENPGSEGPRQSPRLDLPRVNPQLPAPRSMPKFDIPRSAPRVDVPRSSPRIEVPRSAPRIEIPRASSGAGRGNPGRGDRDRDRD
jgi:hypothetical protein